jgi:hypothetical protein
MFIMKSSNPLWREQMTISDEFTCRDYIESEKDLKAVEESIESCIRIINKAAHQTTVFDEIGLPDFEDAQALIVQARDEITDRINAWSQGDDA